MRIIKMIWDFKGEDGKATADHFVNHLEEFADKHQIEHYKVEVTPISKNNYAACMEVSEEHLTLVRDALQPHRAQWVEEKEEEKN